LTAPPELKELVERFERTIQATDKEVDALVYRLSEEEIKIVDGALIYI
jgi:hypothetical protein